MLSERKGRIILLNGASSSGKTSIGRALLPLLADPWFLIPADQIGAMRSTVHTRHLDDAEIAEMLRRTRVGYHRAVAALASAGNDVIMDYPLSEQWRLDDLLQTLRGYDVTLVEVRCSPAELERRERERGDRPLGTALSQTLVYTYGQHDIAVDTTSTSPIECATTIASAFEAIPVPKAFDRLRVSVMDPLAELVLSYLDDLEIALHPHHSWREEGTNLWAYVIPADGFDARAVAAALDHVAQQLSERFTAGTFYAWYDEPAGQLRCSLSSKPADQLPFDGRYTPVTDAAEMLGKAAAASHPGVVLIDSPEPDDLAFPVWVAAFP